MLVYLTESQVPELRSLAPSLRRLVVSRALTLMRSETRLFCWLPTCLCVIGGVVGALLGTMMLSYLHPAQLTGDGMIRSMVWTYSGVGVVAFSAGFAGLLLQRWKLQQ